MNCELHIFICRPISLGIVLLRSRIGLECDASESTYEYIAGLGKFSNRTVYLTPTCIPGKLLGISRNGLIPGNYPGLNNTYLKGYPIANTNGGRGWKGMFYSFAPNLRVILIDLQLSVFIRS